MNNERDYSVGLTSAGGTQTRYEASEVDAAQKRKALTDLKEPPSLHSAPIEHATVVRSIERSFGEALKQLGLNESQQSETKRLLVERYERLEDNRKALFSVTARGDIDISQLDESVRSEIDESLRSAAGTAWPAVQRIMELGVHWSAVQSGYATDMKAEGYPLTLTQSLDLAEALRMAGSAVVPSSDLRGESLDAATGLSEYDRQILSAMSGILSTQQVELLRRALVASHPKARRYSK